MASALLQSLIEINSTQKKANYFTYNVDRFIRAVLSGEKKKKKVFLQQPETLRSKIGESK